MRPAKHTLDDLHAIADTLRMNLDFDEREGTVEGSTYRTVTLCEGVVLGLTPKVIAAYVSQSSACVLVQMSGDLGLFVVARGVEMRLVVVDLAKLPARGVGLFKSETWTLHAMTARKAEKLLDEARVAVFDRLSTETVWTRASV